LCHRSTEFASETNRLGYVVERVFSRSNLDEGDAFHEKVGQRKKTAMTQQRNSAKSPTHLVFVMAVYCMEPEW